MSYAIDGVRHLMYGGPGTSPGRDLLALAAWFVTALAASTLAARKQRVWPAKKLQPELELYQLFMKAAVSVRRRLVLGWSKNVMRAS